ncbi:hypothetical protein EJB05_00435, partial [Eragrostis curvula]
MCALGAIGSELIQLALDDKVYDYLPQGVSDISLLSEFECTPKDKLAIEYARNSAERKVLVDINGSFVFLPINIDNQHWYLAVINAKKRNIQVLDSLCWTHSRDDLNTTLEALEHNFKKAQEGGHHINPSWSDVLVSSWDVDEHLTSTLQNDCVSCGLFLLTFIEHFSGNSLTAEITQEDIVKFRLKLIALLILWKTNASEFSPYVEADKDNGSPDDCVEQEDSAAPDAAMQRLDCVRAAKRAKRGQQNMKMRYDTLVFLVSLVDAEQLFSGICAYLSLLDSKDHLESTWASSNDPYPIKLTCEKLRDIMDLKKPMDVDCFNLGVRLMACNEFKSLKGSKIVEKHLMDLSILSDYMILHFMQTWTGEETEFLESNQVDQLGIRGRLLRSLLRYEYDTNGGNLPDGIRDIVSIELVADDSFHIEPTLW